ncbi:mannitol-1-phosphate 5-dehydrogenase [Paenibacillus sp. FSL H8-0548]|uniref:mannitol-1-phosphate 5-dehydrogenase n=1 Tax=Paenibacillus sp. FSL H8-0548 TaxID=1920422 RepID=UPI00096CB4BA|nr:mannitol-1-phosphate 5-dehydrogenase [Paenibacillus sp. FSL H8-0548]OMF32580.1 mannitol-1-phosphate 5-dehydrogenase [Paenibacillus sp. FSL H8-0548]
MKAVHFGAGNIGRGFIGLLLHNAGFEICFSDVNDALVANLQEKQQYTVKLANEPGDTYLVDHITAINGKDLAQVAEKIAEADIVTTAVGVSILKHIAAAVAKGIELRLSNGEAKAALPIIACENTLGGSTILKQFVYEHLSAEMQALADQHIVFPNAAVDRIVPLQQHEDPLLVVVEPFYEWTVERSPLLSSLPEIEGIHYVDQLEPYIERKLFTVNTGHCVAAYHGYLRGYETIQEAMKDPAVVAEVKGALLESGAALVQTYQFDERAHALYVDQILERFINPYLVDEIARIGRSPIRKLSPSDRLVRPALLAYELNIPVTHLTAAMAAALLFQNSDDPEAIELQTAIREQGLTHTITKYTGLDEQHPLHKQVAEQYQELEQTFGSAGKGMSKS